MKNKRLPDKVFITWAVDAAEAVSRLFDREFTTDSRPFLARSLAGKVGAGQVVNPEELLGAATEADAAALAAEKAGKWAAAYAARAAVGAANTAKATMIGGDAGWYARDAARDAALAVGAAFEGSEYKDPEYLLGVPEAKKAARALGRRLRAMAALSQPLRIPLPRR